eukprot:TRINITY_DN2746_c0_g1_i1.p1 TRINITY_DN2746_c0_g1~~TRINITY_DN2746_c0_g1_i1.p1  ORF type:complete len:484 (+),score=153.32 TRINITY_DN2746_c0_g1_i1:48-1499(+)
MIRYFALLFILFILSTNSQNVIELNDSNFDSEVTEEDWLINFYTKDCTLYDELEKWSNEKKLDLRFGQINAVKEAYLISTFHLKNLTAPFWILTKNWTENFVLEGESNLDGLKEFLSGEYKNSKIPLFYEMFDHDDDEDDEDIRKEEKEEINSYLLDEQKKMKEENKKKDNKDNTNKGSTSTSKDNDASHKANQETPAKKPKVVMKEYKEVDKRAPAKNNKNNQDDKSQQDKKKKTEEDEDDEEDEKPSKNTKTETEKVKDSKGDPKDDSKDDEEEEFKWPYDPDTIVLTSNNFEIKTSTGLWLVDFYAPWCPHCQELAVVWAKLATRVKKELAGRVNIAKIDVDKHEAISSKYNVEYLPSIVYFRSGMMYTYEGEHNEDDLIKFIRKDYKKTQGTRSINEFVKRAPETDYKSSDRVSSNSKTSEPSFLASICNRRCQRFLLNPLFISSLLLALIGLFVFLLVKKPSDDISFVKKSRRKKKIV